MGAESSWGRSPAILLGIFCCIPSVLARRCFGSNCRRSSLSTGARIAIGVCIAVLILLLLAVLLFRRCLLRRRLHRQQNAGFSIAPPILGATASSNLDGAGAAGAVGDGRYPHPYYSNNGGNMTQAYPNGFGSGVGQGAGRVPAPPPSYSAGGRTNGDGNKQYEGNMTDVGGFRPPPGPPPGFDAHQKV